MGLISKDHGPGQVILEYVEACRTGSAERLRAIFHPDALMSGYFRGETPNPSETGRAYSGEITSVDECGNCASVTLKETGYLGCNFTNWFHLARVNEAWVILAKSYIDE